MMVMILMQFTLSFEFRTVASCGGMRRITWGLCAYTGSQTLAGKFKLTKFNSAISLGVLSSLFSTADKFLPIWMSEFISSSCGDSLAAPHTQSSAAGFSSVNMGSKHMQPLSNAWPDVKSPRQFLGRPYEPTRLWPYFAVKLVSLNPCLIAGASDKDLWWVLGLEEGGTKVPVSAIPGEDDGKVGGPLDGDVGE